ncbi:MAG: c-type cytochrome [Polaromonas sp.]|jgi:cytochrome c peroxidase|nr:c-type cytochrome [Polaromonas sp.]
MRIKTLFSLLLSLTAYTGTVTNAFAAEPVHAIPQVKPLNPAKVELGKKLYFDPRISQSGTMSCNTCHNLSLGGTDNLKTSLGHNWQQAQMNTPTVLNSTFNKVQFWDGRLHEEAKGVYDVSPADLAFMHDKVIDVLNSIPGYKQEFKKAYGSNTITRDMLVNALTAFNQTLVTPDSRFDKWLKGDKGALTKTELDGYKLFKQSGCTTCHDGMAMGGSNIAKMGLTSKYETRNKAKGAADLTGKDEDRMKFKVPTMRNVELTYPYFHDGGADTLEKAVDIMGKLQLGRTYSGKEIDQIVAFLKTLTGKQPDFKLPILPASSNSTPLPKTAEPVRH